MTQATEPPPTIVTLTLPTPEGGGIAPERTTATLLIQRGELAHVRQFHYNGFLDDLFVAVREAHEALGLIEDNPPVLPDPPPPKKEVKLPAQMLDAEPTIDVPLSKGKVSVKISHLKIVGGETDAAAYRQAVLIAGRLIDGKLWDGKSPIRIDDAYATMRKIQHLKDKEFALFKLEDFVQTGSEEEAQPEEPTVSD